MKESAFAKWFHESGLTLESAAEMFDVDFGTVGKWVRGTVTPHPLRWKHIERVTKKAVPADSWKERA
jgi:hypothetical protein